MTTPFLDELRTLIEKDDALDDATQRLTAFLSTADRTLYNETLAQAGRQVDLRRRWRRGELTAEQHTTARNRLRAAFLDLLDEVERASARLRFPFAHPGVEPRWPEGGTLEAIIGANRIQSMAWLRRGLDVSRSVCRITAAAGIGTGFLIDGGWIVTNHHVLPGATSAGGARAEFDVEEDVDGTLRQPCVYLLDASTWRGNVDVDCAIVKPAPPAAGQPDIASWGTLGWAPETQPVSPGDYVSIIQHPNGGPKRIAVSENQVVNLYEHRLQYTTDTQPGSSGSPVFDDAWRVVAVHHAGGTLVVNPKGDRRFINEGILARHARGALGLT